MALLEVNFERLISRNTARAISRELDLAGMKMSVNKLLGICIIGAVATLIAVSFVMFYMQFNFLISWGGGMVAGAVFMGVIYMVLEFYIDARKTKMENMLPDFFQITAANLRSGISLERAMLLAARPEFTFLSEEVKELNRRVFGGQTLELSLAEFGQRYRSFQLNHAIRMISESLRYGGAMADLIGQISADMRNQQLIQKEVAGQLLMYTIFVAFAGLIAAPVLYGLTSQMIVVTDDVWNGILQSNPNGLPSAGVSFLKPAPPQITPAQYDDFSYAAIIIITGFASLIMSAISSGSAVKGLRFMPIFIVVGIIIFIMVQNVIGAMFSGLGAA